MPSGPNWTQRVPQAARSWSDCAVMAAFDERQRVRSDVRLIDHREHLNRHPSRARGLRRCCCLCGWQPTGALEGAPGESDVGAAQVQRRRCRWMSLSSPQPGGAAALTGPSRGSALLLSQRDELALARRTRGRRPRRGRAPLSTRCQRTQPDALTRTGSGAAVDAAFSLHRLHF